MIPEDVKVGDWISWMQNDEIKYGQVTYITRDPFYPQSIRAVCNNGSINISSILEARRVGIAVLK